MRIGFTGVPPLEIIQEQRLLYPNSEWLDLDVPTKNIAKYDAIDYIPETTCSVIQTILANSLSIKPDIIIASVGAGKCDSMTFLIPIIKRLLPNTIIIERTNDNKKGHGFEICTSSLPLLEKFEAITNMVVNTTQRTIIETCKPKAGFWGVPPYDFSILKLFPDRTHIFGWTRCMENKTPNNLEMELYVDESLPTVFYSQAFCSKNILAKELAKKYKGLYVEADGLIDNSTKEKVKAFLELKNCY